MLSLANEAMAPTMTVQNRVNDDPRVSIEADTLTIGTRFGDYEVLRRRMISFPKGLIGFIGYQSFALLNLPEGKARYLKLLQSTGEASLGFYVLPVTVETSGFEATDIAEIGRAHV